MAVTWRAALANGSVVEQDGGNTPQAFLDDIVEFQLLRDGKLAVRVCPDVGERVVYRRRTAGFSTWTVAHIIGIVSLDNGVASLAELDERGVLRLGFVDSVEFSAAEVA